jgi:hypothetical protein
MNTKEVHALKTLAREKTKTVIARKLKRSVDAVYRLASKLGAMLGEVEKQERGSDCGYRETDDDDPCRWKRRVTRVL